MTHPPGTPKPTPQPKPGGPAGPGRLSDRALVRIFTLLPVALGIVLAVVVAGGGA